MTNRQIDWVGNAVLGVIGGILIAGIFAGGMDFSNYLEARKKCDARGLATHSIAGAYRCWSETELRVVP